MNADERLRIATSDEPQTWDTALPNVSPADPGDENTPCRSCGDTGMQNAVEPCQECQQDTWEWRRVQREKQAERCDWCGAKMYPPRGEGTAKYCGTFCETVARNDGQHG